MEHDMDHELLHLHDDHRDVDMSNDGERSSQSNALIIPRPKRILEPLRIFAFRAIRQMTRWKAMREEKKIALHHSRCVALWHVLLHLIPLGGAITLLVLNYTRYFIGRQPLNGAAFQFVAKLHELLMQASIVEVVLAIVRTQAIKDHIPLGAFTAWLQAQQISYIWSLDFLASLTSDFGTQWRKRLMLTVAVPILIFTTGVVGPSSAVLLIPRAESRSRSQYDHYSVIPQNNESKLFQTPFPSTINSSGGFPYTSSNHVKRDNFVYDVESDTDQVTIYDNNSIYNFGVPLVMPRLLQSIPESPKTLKKRARSDATQRAFAMPTTFSTDRLGSRLYMLLSQMNSFDTAFTATLQTKHPLVKVSCDTSPDQTPRDITYFDFEAKTTKSLGQFKQLFQDNTFLNVPQQFSLVDPPVLWLLNPDSTSALSVGLFFDIQNTSCTYELKEITSGSLRTFFLGEAGEQWLNECWVRLRACSVIAYWRTGVDVVNKREGSWLIQSPSPKASEIGQTTPIRVNPSLMPQFQSSRYVETYTVGADFTIALAGWSSNLNFDLRGPQDGIKLDFEYWENGYGYGSYSNSVILALVVITVYCTITVTYLAYVLITGHTSTAWNSPIELLCLALQSKKPGHLGHISVGIETTRILQQKVGILVNDSGELQLVFASDHEIDESNMKKITPNKEY